MRHLAIVLVVLAGCITVSKSVLMDRSSMPVPVEDVYVFLPGDRIPEDCERVAILSAEGDEDLTDQGDMIDRAAVTETGAERRASAQSLWCPSRAEGVPPLR